MKYTSAIMTEASGSLRGIVAAKGSGGAYFRGKTIPKNVLSTGQQSRRNRLATLASRWTNTLTTSQRDAWRLYAAGRSLTGHPVSGIDEYIALNSISGIVFPSVFRDTAPTVYTNIVLPAANVDNIDHTTGDITITFTAASPWNVSQGRLLLFLTKPTNPWKYAPKTQKFITAIVGSSSSPFTALGAYPYTCSAGMFAYGYFIALGPTSDTRVSAKYAAKAPIT